MKKIHNYFHSAFFLKMIILGVILFHAISASAATIYIGDDSPEGLNITQGTGQDTSGGAVTYGFVTTPTTYANTSSFIQLVNLTQVNFYAGTASGTLTPFVSLYTGNQTATSIQTATNYRVLLIGDPISVTGNSGRQNTQFLVGGMNPTLTLAPGQVLTVGYLSSSGGVVQYGSGSGTIDYVALGNTLPATVPNSFTANATTSLDRTLKYNVGFSVHTGPFNVACIGDSITAGVGSSNPSNDYPSQLQDLLGDDYIVTNYGVSSTTMLKNGDFPYWNTSAYTSSLAASPDIVIIMLGTNDSKPQNWTYQSQFLSNYIDMINSYRALPSHPMIYVNTCPTVAGSGNYGITNPIVTGQVVPLVKQAAAATGAPVNDVNTGTAFIPLDFPDNVHPNDAGHLTIANVVFTGLTGSQVIALGHTYNIIGKYSGKPVEVAASSLASGANVDISSDTGSNTQKWILSALSGNYYKIVNVNSGQVADVTGGSNTSGATIIQNTYTGATSQQWQIVNLGLGYYNIVNRNSGCVFDVTGASSNDGTLLEQATSSSTADEQKFQLIDQTISFSNRIEASSYNSENSVGLENCIEGGVDVEGITNGSYTVYNNVNLNGMSSFEARVASAGSGGSIVIHLDSATGTVIGTATVPITGGWQTWTTVNCSLSGASGYHNVYLVYTGGGGYLFNVEWFNFQGICSLIGAASYSSLDPGTAMYLQNSSEGGENLANIGNGDYAVYSNINLNGVTTFTARTASPGSGGTIVIHLDSPTGTVIGTCTTPGTGNWQVYSSSSCSLSATSGTHNIYLVFTTGGFNLEWFLFQ
jgi:lysophospholipase L1-like esterase